MVFGNLGENSATGVAFTRDPATGENVLYGEYLVKGTGRRCGCRGADPQEYCRDG
ncbi:MAG: hypothetical protein CM1200mP9_05580 [Gammaproteobacteria bacterium]|nr:MAG: hypothetical protein CM1200mP9_05580 [Gammaproteobacteria bacterium]